MDKTILLVARAVLSVAVLGATASYYYFVATRPEFFAPSNTPSYQPSWTWMRYVFYGAAMTGTAICIFLGAQFLLSWMPHSWRVYDEDGGATWVPESIAGIAAFVGGIFLPLALHDLAARKR